MMRVRMPIEPSAAAAARLISQRARQHIITARPCARVYFLEEAARCSPGQWRHTLPQADSRASL